jgi:hypothetical protein
MLGPTNCTNKLTLRKSPDGNKLTRGWSKLTSIMNTDLLELYSDYLLSAFSHTAIPIPQIQTDGHLRRPSATISHGPILSFLGPPKRARLEYSQTTIRYCVGSRPSHPIYKSEGLNPSAGGRRRHEGFFNTLAPSRKLVGALRGV